MSRAKTRLQDHGVASRSKLGRFVVCLLLASVGMLLPTIAAADSAVPMSRSWPHPSQEGSGVASEDEAREMGLKTKTVSAACRLLAKGIRAGDKVANKLIGRLDDASRAAFRKHSDAIADQLEKISKETDLVPSTVKDMMIMFMTRTLGVESVIARDIGDGIGFVIFVLL